MADLAPTEITALARIVDELDYYQLLHLERGVDARRVKKAYYATSRAFHPDANRHLSSDLQSAIGRIAKRVTEAYSVLRDPRRRRAYDRLLESGSGVRMQLADAAAEAGRESEERRGQTPQGRQYYQLASEDKRRGDPAAAIRNLQTALTFEPDNAHFRELLETLRKEREAQRKQLG